MTTFALESHENVFNCFLMHVSDYKIELKGESTEKKTEKEEKEEKKYLSMFPEDPIHRLLMLNEGARMKFPNKSFNTSKTIVRPERIEQQMNSARNSAWKYVDKCSKEESDKCKESFVAVGNELHEK